MLIGVDVGGTFTDVVAISDGKIRTVKVSTDVRNTERGVLEGAREIGVQDADVFSHASTHGLNAVITRRLPSASPTGPRIGWISAKGRAKQVANSAVRTVVLSRSRASTVTSGSVRRVTNVPENTARASKAISRPTAESEFMQAV